MTEVCGWHHRLITPVGVDAFIIHVWRFKLKAIGRARAAGKTHELITEHFMKSDCFLLVMNERERERIISQYGLSKEKQTMVLTWDTAKERLHGRHGDILIDNIDILLLNLFHRNPVAITFTGRCG